jgi:A/G-specific adenine glycosylase
LHCRNGDVLLVQRARDVSLMPGMWELPELAGTNGATSPSFTLRHSITVTDYTVRVWRNVAPSGAGGKWISLARLNRVALTGLARKILRKAEML